MGYYSTAGFLQSQNRWVLWKTIKKRIVIVDGKLQQTTVVIQVKYDGDIYQLLEEVRVKGSKEVHWDQ